MTPKLLIRVQGLKRGDGVLVTYAGPSRVGFLTLGEYLKEVHGYAGVRDGRYRVSFAPKTGRFEFRVIESDGTDVFLPSRSYQLFDRGVRVRWPAGGYWCASQIRLFDLARSRFNLIRVKRAR